MSNAELLDINGRNSVSNGLPMADASLNLKRLLEIRKLLSDQLNEVDRLIAQVQGIQAKISQFSPTLLKAPALPSAYFSGSGLRPRGPVPPSEIANRVEVFLKAAKRPMTRSELARKLIENGVPLLGKDINKNIGTIMWRHQERFVNLPGLGYWLKDEPLEGVYQPNMDE